MYKKAQDKGYNQAIMRVLIFSTAYYPLVSGAEISIKEITDRLPSHEFDLITSNEPGVAKEEKIGRVNVYRVGPKGKIGKYLLPIFGTFKTWSLLKQNKYDLFWALMVTYASGVPYIVNIKRKLLGRKKIPVLLDLQEGDSEDYISRKILGMIGLSWRLALKRTDYLTVLSNYLAERARVYGYKGEISVVPNGVDIEKFTKTFSKKEISDLKNRLSKKEGDVFLVHTGRFNVKNALCDVITALSKLDSKVKLILIGKGELEEDLKNQAKELGVLDRIQFLGFMDLSEIPIYLKVCDIFIRPSLSEGMGSSFIEAMAVGIPVVATRVGGLADFLNEGVTGFECKPRNPASIAEAVKRVLENKDKTKQVIENAKRMIEENYDWQFIAPKMDAVFKKAYGK